MGRDQNDNAIKVQHHGCGIALSAKAGPDKILAGIQKILADDRFKQAATSFQKEIQSHDRTSEFQELENLIGPISEERSNLNNSNMRYAS